MWQKYLFASTLEEAVALLTGYHGDARIIAGGTDLILALEKREKQAKCLVDVTRIPGLDGIELNDDVITIGANVTHARLAESSLIRKHASALAEAAASVGSPQIRSMGTIGGNVVTGSPAADTVPPLLCLDTRVVLRGGNGERRVPLADFLVGPGQVDITSDEVLTELEFPVPVPGSSSTFLKIGRRNAMAVAIVNVAVQMHPREATLNDVRVAMGCVAPTVVRCHSVERALHGQSLDDNALLAPAEALQRDIKPISDLRGTARYRRLLASSLLRRSLVSAAEAANGSPSS